MPLDRDCGHRGGFGRRTFSYGYDSIDRMVSESGPAGSVVVAYDDLDRRKQLQVSGQGLVTYGYNLTNAIETITQNGQSATFQYDPMGRMSQRLLPNGVSTEWGFDTAGFLRTVISKRNGVAFDSHTLTPDPVGNITQETITNAGGTQQNSFGYDDLHRLQTASVGGVASSWVYDNTGNRTSQTVGGVTTSYTPDDANRFSPAVSVPAARATALPR
jgi:YD repeat-containing protein